MDTVTLTKGEKEGAGAFRHEHQLSKGLIKESLFCVSRSIVCPGLF
jgi:hypothetical protein